MQHLELQQLKHLELQQLKVMLIKGEKHPVMQNQLHPLTIKHAKAPHQTTSHQPQQPK